MHNYLTRCLLGKTDHFLSHDGGGVPVDARLVLYSAVQNLALDKKAVAFDHVPARFEGTSRTQHPPPNKLPLNRLAQTGFEDGNVVPISFGDVIVATVAAAWYVPANEVRVG